MRCCVLNGNGGWWRRAAAGVFAVAAGAWLAAGPAAAQPVPTVRAGGSTNGQVLILPSPLDSVRRMLALSPAERARVLATRKPEHRQALEAKFAEFDALSPEEREARLQMLQLRHYVSPLLRVAPSNRVAALSMIPPADRGLVQERLEHWDRESPEQQRRFLEHETAVSLFLRSGSGPASTNGPGLYGLGTERAVLEHQLAAWNNLPAERRREIQDQFEKFFTVNSNRQEKILVALNTNERQLLQRIVRLPLDQRVRCLKGFEKFTQLSEAERASFLKAAERWQAMGEQQRAMWRELARQLPPDFPLPTGSKGPPRPPSFSTPPKKLGLTTVGTN